MAVADTSATAAAAATIGGDDAEGGYDFDGMGIYIKGRVGNELRELVKEKGSLTVEDVYHVTTMHYLGEEPIDNFESILRGLSTPLSEVRVLEIGSGFAGDARVLASRTGCKISCVEIQEHISEQAEALSSQLKLSHLVTHIHGDILTTDPPEEKFNAMISVLTVLHISDRAKLWKSVHDHLIQGAPIYVEDFYLRQPLSEENEAALKAIVACPYLPSKDDYKKQLEDASFEDIKFEVHGEPLTRELTKFYDTVHSLFSSGQVGGVRITAVKK